MNPTPVPAASAQPSASLAEAYSAEMGAAMERKKANGELDGAQPGQLLMAQAEAGRSIVKSWLHARRSANKAASFAPGYDPAASARAEAEIAALLIPAKPAPKA